jgi:hypothetical protein
MYCQNRIIWLLKVIFKNRFVSPFPQKPTSGHESCLPARNVSSNPESVDVIEYPNPAIKGKKNQ